MKFNYDGEKLESFLQDNFYKILVGVFGAFLFVTNQRSKKTNERMMNEYTAWLIANKVDK